MRTLDRLRGATFQMTDERRWIVVCLGTALLLGCGSGSDSGSSQTTASSSVPDADAVAASDPSAATGSAFTLKMHRPTGETPFTQLAYECDECSFEQFAAIEPPDGWSKGPAQVILPIGELRSTPTFEGVPSTMDFIPEIPGDEFTLIAKTIDGTIVENGDNGLMVVADVMRDEFFRFPEGSRVHEVTDPEGNVFVLFAYEVESVDFASPDFDVADALADHPVPEGWTYSTRVLDEDLVMESNGVATVLAITQEPHSVWQQR